MDDSLLRGAGTRAHKNGLFSAVTAARARARALYLIMYSLSKFLPRRSICIVCEREQRGVRVARCPAYVLPCSLKVIMPDCARIKLPLSLLTKIESCFCSLERAARIECAIGHDRLRAVRVGIITARRLSLSCFCSDIDLIRGVL